MDERLEKVEKDCTEAFYEFGKAVIEAAREMGERMREYLSRMEELDEALSSISAAFDEITALAFDRTEARQKERNKWRSCSSVRVPVFLHDKRGKVHRCRNNC